MGFNTGSDPNVAAAGGAGDASAANQTTEIARLTSLVAGISGTVSVSGTVTVASHTVNQGLASAVAWPVFTSQTVSALVSGTVSVSGNVGVSGTITSKTQDSAGQVQYNFPAGFVRTTDEPRQLFYDPFDSSLDTTNRWNAAVAVGGGVAAAVSAGNLTLGTGTNASGYSHLSSQASFTPTIPGWLGISFALKVETPVTANTYRFWGQGTVPGTPTTSAPLTDAFGFELDTTGKLYAVVYAAGVRTVVQDLSTSGNSKQPTDGLFHRYIIYYRTDKTFFYIDTLDTPVATANFISPTVQTLPNRLLCVAASSAPASSGVITCAGLAIWDTAKNNSTISDGTFGWRKLTVTAGGNIGVNQGVASATAWPVFTSQAVSGVMSVSGAVSGVQSISGTVSVAQGAASAVAWPFFTSQTVSTVVSGTVTALVTGFVSVSNTVVVTGTANQGAASAAAYWLVAHGALSAACASTQYYNGTLSNVVSNVKASSGLLYGYQIYNPNQAAVAYVQFFAVTAASTTLSSTVPIYVVAIPSAAAVSRSNHYPQAFSTGIAIAATLSPSGSTANPSPIFITVDYK